MSKHGERGCHTKVFSHKGLSHHNFMVRHRIPCANCRSPLLLLIPVGPLRHAITTDAWEVVLTDVAEIAIMPDGADLELPNTTAFIMVMGAA